MSEESKTEETKSEQANPSKFSMSEESKTEETKSEQAKPSKSRTEAVHDLLSTIQESEKLLKNLSDHLMAGNMNAVSRILEDEFKEARSGLRKIESVPLAGANPGK